MGSISKFKEGDYILLLPYNQHTKIGRILEIIKIGYGSPFKTYYGIETELYIFIIKDNKGRYIEYYSYSPFKIITEEEYLLEAI
jgi:hypothetical protein